MNNFKILPLLIFVAMLAFSVRMADVLTGVSELGGAALAEDQKAEEAPVAAEGAAPLAGTDEKAAVTEETVESEAAPVKEESHETAEKTEADKKEVVPVEWRDPNDEDPGYMAVRQEIFDDLSKRREDLDKRDRELVTREALLQAAEQELDRKFQELTALKKEMEQLLIRQSEEEKAQVQSLVKIYEGMKPKDAARIFDTLDLDILVSVVGAMSERKLSPVIAQMNPERARTLTIMLAEQKKLPELPESN